MATNGSDSHIVSAVDTTAMPTREAGQPAPDPFAAADAGQIAMMHKLEEKFPVGAKGVNAFGGSGFTITATQFKMRPDGFIEYAVTSEKYVPAQISHTIGVASQPAKTLVQTMTGRILKNANGSLKSLVVEKHKTTEKTA